MYLLNIYYIPSSVLHAHINQGIGTIITPILWVSKLSWVKNIPVWTWVRCMLWHASARDNSRLQAEAAAGRHVRGPFLLKHVSPVMAFKGIELWRTISNYHKYLDMVLNTQRKARKLMRKTKGVIKVGRSLRGEVMDGLRGVWVLELA